jgi:hypothetical protein
MLRFLKIIRRPTKEESKQGSKNILFFSKPKDKSADAIKGQLQIAKRKKGTQEGKKKGAKSKAKQKVRGWVITAEPESLQLSQFIVAVDAVATSVGGAPETVSDYIAKVFSHPFMKKNICSYLNRIVYLYVQVPFAMSSFLLIAAG